MKVWIIRGLNSDATQYYVDVLEEASRMAGYEVEQVSGVEVIKECPREDIYWVITCIDFLKVCYLYKKKKCFFWMQGIAPEESYMNHQSSLRKIVLGCIEKLALSKSQFNIFVSNEMVKHCQEKYKLKFQKYYVMPCFNGEINEAVFYTEGKYENNVFCYAGSLSVWQGIDTILDCYKKIETWNIPNTQLLLLTADQEKAEQLMEKYKIKNYSIKYVQPSELSTAMKNAKFGFVIREDTTVNRVSTPTKISAYMGNGLIPIYSECIKDFAREVQEYKYVLEYGSKDFEERLRKLMGEQVSARDIYREYETLFSNYYSRKRHVKNLSVRIKEYVDENVEGECVSGCLGNHSKL